MTKIAIGISYLLQIHLIAHLLLAIGDELIGHSFLMNPKEDGTYFRAEIFGYNEEFEGQLEREAE